MPSRKSEPEDGPRYLTQAEVAHQLGYRSNSSVRNLITNGLLRGVKVSPKGGLRVTRESFLDYCKAIEAEAEAEQWYAGGAA